MEIGVYWGLMHLPSVFPEGRHADYLRITLLCKHKNDVKMRSMHVAVRLAQG
jgi:hypothetical protein